MNSVRLSILTAVMALLATSCGKKSYWPELVLPEATQTGQNTAGARVDGKTWRTQADVFAGGGTSAYYLREGAKHKLSISLNRYTDDGAPFAQTHIYLSVPDIKGPGTVSLNQSANPLIPPSNPAYAEYTAPNKSYLTGPDATGILVVTRLDTVAHIVSGTFDFKARLNNGPEGVAVTEGRFDIKY